MSELRLPVLPVLIVDDDFDIREALGDLLRSEGYSVCFAQHGKEALDVLRSSEHPGLILLDLSMPVMDGATFRRAQWQDAALAAIPVVILSASGSLAALARPLKPAGELAKPVDIDKLLTYVERYCARSPTSAVDRQPATD